MNFLQIKDYIKNFKNNNNNIEKIINQINNNLIPNNWLKYKK